MMDSGTNDGLKVYLQWSFDRSERINLSPIRNYYWNVVGFAIKIPESANSVDVEDYITSLKELKLLDVNFVGANATGLAGIGWGGISSKTFTNAVDPILIPKSFRRYDAYSNSGRFIYVETEPSEMEFKLSVNELSPSYSEGDLYGFNIAAKGLINTVFEPFIPQTFQNSDCNPIINNATDVTPSTVYYDVDYANNPNVAVNFDTILAGTSPKAKIQDFNYHTRRNTIPRYEGSKNGNTTNYSVEGASIDATQALFGYFNWVGGTAPEWGNGLEDRSVANLRFLLDVNGKIIKPIKDSAGINQGIVENNFTEGKIATLAFDDEAGSSAGFSNLLGDHIIFKSGKDITPIIYSQTGSIGPNSSTDLFTGSLTFVQGDQAESTVDDYRLTVFTQNQTIIGTGNVTFQTPTVEGSEASFTSNVYSPDSSPSSQSPQTTLNFKVFIQKEFTANADATFQLQKNDGGGWVNFGPSANLDANIDDSITIQTSDPTALSTDSYRLRITAENSAGQGNLLSIKGTSYLRVQQTPPPSIGAVGPDTPGGTNYWTKLGTTTNQFRTNALTAVLGQRQQDIEGSGFFGITNDFVLEVGDEIRFQGTETQTYKITAIDVATNPSYAGALVYTVDRNLTLTNTEMNWFLVRRYIDNPANIILEVDKPAGGTSPGILKPQYLSKNAEDNIDTILENLRRDSLI